MTIDTLDVTTIKRFPQVWVDSDALPRPLKDYLIKASDRLQLTITFVANSPLAIPASAHLHSAQVPKTPDAADHWIAARVQAHDLVVTQDIPLAAEVCQLGAYAISLRGEPWTMENIKNRLHLRDYMDMLRGSGVQTGGAPAFSDKDKKNFADGFERMLRLMQRQTKG